MQPQRHYNQRMIAQAGGLPAMPQMQAAPVDTSGAQIAKSLDDFMKVAGPAIGRAYVAQETGRVDEAALLADQKMREWEARYNQENQGSLAANAAADYEAAWKEIAEETAREFDGKGHTVFPDMLRERLLERGGMAMRDGLAYQARQTELWQASQWERQLDGFRRLAANNPLDPVVDQEERALKDSWRLKNPGMDPGKIDNEISEMKITGQLEAAHAQGNPQLMRAILARAQAQGKRKAIIKGMAPVVEKLIRETAAAHGFDEDGIEILLAQAMQESGGRRDVVSHKGAIGVMQLMPGTAKELGVNPHDLAQNIEGGIRYMKRLLKNFNGDWEAALYAYNMGEQGYRDAMAGKRPWPKENREYTPRILNGRMTRGMPGLSPGALSRHQSQIEALERQQLAAERQKMKAGLDNYYASSLDGNIVKRPYSDEQIRQVFGADADVIIKQMRGAEALAIDMDAASRMSLQGMNEMLAAKAPDPNSPTYREDAARHDKLTRHVMGLQKMIMDDPVAYAASHNEQAGKARERMFKEMTPEAAGEYATQMLAACEAMGVMPRLFSNGDAQMLAATLTRSDSPLEAISQFSQAMGGHWPQAVKEIARNLAPMYRLIAAGGMSPEAGRLIVRSLRDKDFDKKSQELLGMEGTDVKEFRARAHEYLADLHFTFMGAGNQEMPLALEKAMGNLALQYMGTRGLNQKQALKLARDELVGKRWNLIGQDINGEGNAPCLRLPRSLDGHAAQIEAGVKYLKANPQVEGLDMELPGPVKEESRAEILRRTLSRQGYWLTDKNEGGAVLFCNGRVVYGKDGNPVRKSFDELSSIGAGALAEEQKRLDLLAAGGGGNVNYLAGGM